MMGTLMLLSTAALAQSGGLGTPGSTLPSKGGGPARSGKAPATHAAPGGDGPSLLPTEAAKLPPDPNDIPEELQDVLGSDHVPDYDAGKGETVERKWYGPYYSEASGSYRFQTLFPFWVERQQGEDRSSLYGLTYYQRRSPKVDADVVFPFFWKFRHDQTYTTVAGPVVHSESPTGHTNWLPPLYFEGSDSSDGTEYLHIPALLTFHHRTNDHGFSMVGPLFCKWEGGNACDNRTATEITYGVAPFYFYGRDQDSEWEVIPPLLHYYRYDERNDEALNVWGPLWSEHSRDGGVFNIMPFYWHSWGPNSEATTVFPFFHYGRSGNATTLITPLFVHHVDDENAETFASLLYARHRGRTELDMITPLYWQYRDPDADI
ncbi:MAG TPA: hypothetical protein ENK23_02910, partial [Sorangium sp.]|nr:hypothetical protein [Sorangium sp.]